MQKVDNSIHQRITQIAQTIGSRMSGTVANQMARDYIRKQMESTGAKVEVQEYPCPAWQCKGISLSQAGIELPVLVNPFSSSCQVSSVPQFVSTLAELEQADINGQVVVLMGDLTSQVISCKSWFLIEERDIKILGLLEQKQPGAILTVQPEPGSINRILEDWEVLIPSATISTETALFLLDHANDPLELQITTRREPGSTANVVARISGQTDEWICLMAHYDTKIDTPGAIDNGTGVVILLELLDYFQENQPAVGLEFIAFAGEEYLPIGDDEYLRLAGEDHLGKVKYVINFDGTGHKLGSDSLACIVCSSEFGTQVGQLLAKSSSIIPSEPWPESNHSTFTFRGVPGLAYTSRTARIVAHQLDDSIRWVDEAKMKQVIELTKQIIEKTHSNPISWFRDLDVAG